VKLGHLKKTADHRPHPAFPWFGKRFKQAEGREQLFSRFHSRLVAAARVDGLSAALLRSYLLSRRRLARIRHLPNVSPLQFPIATVNSRNLHCTSSSFWIFVRFRTERVFTGTVAARSSHDSHEISGRCPHRSASVIIDHAFWLLCSCNCSLFALPDPPFRLHETFGRTLDTDSGAALWEIANDLVSEEWISERSWKINQE
jgi:hypothetical protein